ncbi:hypothetical protein C8R45DRAFT_1072793 [Mycena sanguinolenta]|nr:hypothetical protein C8R45DRAFT_1072793 [Mycena sanguinolenta]
MSHPRYSRVVIHMNDPKNKENFRHAGMLGGSIDVLRSSKPSLRAVDMRNTQRGVKKLCPESDVTVDGTRPLGARGAIKRCWESYYVQNGHGEAVGSILLAVSNMTKNGMIVLASSSPVRHQNQLYVQIRGCADAQNGPLTQNATTTEAENR